jgi:Ca-activated chloride channel family protein
MSSRLSVPFVAFVVIVVLCSPSSAQRGGVNPGVITGAGGLRGGVVADTQTASPTQPPPLNDLDTTLLTVSVTGRNNNAVPGLLRDRFHVFEDGDEQKMTYFWEDSRPITVGFIFDDSARMDIHDKVNVLKDAAQSFLQGKDSRDEYFVVRMGDLPDVVASFTTDPKNLPLRYGAMGETALYDAVYVGLAVIKEAANPRKFLVVVTSGGDRCCSDNNKRTTEQMLKSFALKQNVEVYSLFIADDIQDEESEFVHRDATVLADLATMTGGRMSMAPNSARTVEAMMAELARGMKTQYIVGFKSPRIPDGKRRGVKVKIDAPEGSPKLSVWTKAGYYASER